VRPALKRTWSVNPVKERKIQQELIAIVNPRYNGKRHGSKEWLARLRPKPKRHPVKN